MKVLKPSYYEDFKCIADKCSDTCCKNWVISIDRDTYTKYKNFCGGFSEEITNSIEIFDESSYSRYGKIRLNNQKKCNLLDERGLCKVCINLGEDNLSNTCKTYPRRYKNYNYIFEKSIKLSCPEVAKIFINYNNQIEFELNNEEVSLLESRVKPDIISEEKFNFLWATRNIMIEIIQYNQIELWKRMYYVLTFQEYIKKSMKTEKYNDLDSIVDELFFQMKNDVIDKELNYINKNSIIKIDFINQYTDIDFSNESVNRLVKKIKLISKNKDVEQIWDEKEIEFERYFEEREYILENYLVYLIFNFYIDMEKDDMSIMIIVYYVIFKSLLVLKYDEDKKIDNDDLIQILYVYSRQIVDNSPQIQKILRTGIKSDKLEYLLSLIR